MHLNSSKEFPYSMDVAWKALHTPSSLDVEPGSKVTVISDNKWEAHNDDAGTITVYTASFDEDAKKVTIEGESNKKKDHDFIYLTLTEVDANTVKFDIEVVIDTGMHFLAKALGALIAKPTQEILCRHIYHNFQALCTGGETKTMSSDELKTIAKKHYEN